MKKVVIVSGGSSGIGAATVKKFSDLNFIVFNLDINPPEYSLDHATYLECDLSSVKSIEKSVNEITEKCQRIDVVVANAGKHYSGTIENTSEAIFDDIIAINIKGVFFLLNAVLPVMRKQMGGSIIIVGSDQCFIGKPNAAVYGLTKGAIAQLTKSTAIDYAEFTIRVNCVCPGTIDTPLYRQAITNYSKKSGLNLDDIEAAEASQQLLNRIGKPEEVSEFIYFLSSDQAQFITGGLFPIDGGYTAQ